MHYSTVWVCLQQWLLEQVVIACIRVSRFLFHKLRNRDSYIWTFEKYFYFIYPELTVHKKVWKFIFFWKNSCYAKQNLGWLKKTFFSLRGTQSKINKIHMFIFAHNLFYLYFWWILSKRANSYTSPPKIRPEKGIMNCTTIFWEIREKSFRISKSTLHKLVLHIQMRLSQYSD